jgi:predicted ATP-binding protein involved in virulence
VGDIARRLAIANPSQEDILSGEGVVLIDEIDLHLHPSWQALILPTLMDTFPNIQFILTTHSSKILGEIGEDAEIIKLEMQEDDIIAVKIPTLIGWDINTILEKYMGTNSINLGTKEKMDKMFEMIEQEKYDEAEMLADEIERITDSENINVVRARILINRGR